MGALPAGSGRGASTCFWPGPLNGEGTGLSPSSSIAGIAKFSPGLLTAVATGEGTVGTLPSGVACGCSDLSAAWGGVTWTATGDRR